MNQEVRCQSPGCRFTAIAQCAYQDRSGERCKFMGCQTHLPQVQTNYYCPRHNRGISRLLAEGTLPANLPDLENRALSLASWVTGDLGERLPGVLIGYLGDVDVVRLPFGRLNSLSSTSWGSEWKLKDHQSDARVTIDLFVEEENDDQVCLAIQGKVVTRAVYPIVLAHLREEVLPPDVDAASRSLFYNSITDLTITKVSEILATSRMSLSDSLPR